MQRLMMPALGLMVACAASVGFAEEDAVKSGLKKGEAAKFFQVKDVTGPRKGKSLCYR